MVRVAVLLVLLMVVTTWPVSAASAEIIRSAPRNTGAVALTFDDGWGVSACERIAKTLRQADAKATFFINGTYLKRDPKRWRKILKGMPVGNHTSSHPNLVTEPDRVARKQIKLNEKLHEQVLGRPMLKVFRPPYGAYDDGVLKVAGKLGYKHIALWSISAADTSPDATVKTIVRRTTGARPGSIILMHCARDITVEALPQIIAHYQERGIELVGLDELLGMPTQGGSPAKAKSKPKQVAQSVSLGEALERLLDQGVTDVAAIVGSSAAYG